MLNRWWAPWWWGRFCTGKEKRDKLSVCQHNVTQNSLCITTKYKKCTQQFTSSFAHSFIHSFVFFFFFVVELGFELRVLGLQSMHSTSWVMPSALLPLGIIQIGSHVFVQVGLRLCSSYMTGITDMYHHTWLICWDEVLLPFCLDWSWAVILPISASWVAGITGVGHNTAPSYAHSFIKYSLSIYNVAGDVNTKIVIEIAHKYFGTW
jgi:hypothetical protein